MIAGAGLTVAVEPMLADNPLLHAPTALYPAHRLGLVGCPAAADCQWAANVAGHLAGQPINLGIPLADT